MVTIAARSVVCSVNQDTMTSHPSSIDHIGGGESVCAVWSRGGISLYGFVCVCFICVVVCECVDIFVCVCVCVFV